MKLRLVMVVVLLMLMVPVLTAQRTCLQLGWGSGWNQFGLNQMMNNPTVWDSLAEKVSDVTQSGQQRQAEQIANANQQNAGYWAQIQYELSLMGQVVDTGAP